MEFKQVKELISLVNSTDVTDVEIEREGFRVRIRKEKIEVNSAPVQIVETVKAPLASIPSEPRVEADHGFIEIKAPMVGTFYRAPAPDAAPYIQVGEAIDTGQVLFIIEAMKMMNEVESEVKGQVKQILVQDGEPVEYGQPLLLVDPKA